MCEEAEEEEEEEEAETEADLDGLRIGNGSATTAGDGVGGRAMVGKRGKAFDGTCAVVGVIVVIVARRSKFNNGLPICAMAAVTVAGGAGWAGGAGGAKMLLLTVVKAPLLLLAPVSPVKVPVEVEPLVEELWLLLLLLLLGENG